MFITRELLVNFFFERKSVTLTIAEKANILNE